MRPSSPIFSEADPNVPDPDRALAHRPRYRSLRQVIGLMDLDILVELDRFRHWQQSQAQLSSVVPAIEAPTARSSRSQLQSYGVVEDLEAEMEPQRGSFLTSVLVLLLWLLSCSGIGVGLWWLISPGEPDRLLATFARPSPPPLPPLPDLDALPVIKPADLDLATREQQGLVRDPIAQAPETPADQPSPALDLEGVEVRQIQQPTWLDLLQQESSQFGSISSSIPVTAERPSSRVERTEVASSRAPTPQITATPRATPSSTPAPTPTPVTTSPTPSTATPQPTATTQATSSLGSQQGAGTYLVLIQYQGEQSLAQARQVSAGAFVKTINGQEFVQLAAFNQLEHARYMADDLRRQGFAVQVSGG